MATTHDALRVEIQALKRRIGGGGGGGGAPDDHAASHQNGGGDEINVAGLSGLLATAQTPAAHVHAEADVTGLVADLAAKQPLDADLTTIAGLTATTDNFMVAAVSAWASRTPAQAKTSLALVKGDVGLGSVDNTTDAGKPVSAATQTALDLKAPLASPTFTGTVAGITKAMVGLTSADDTSDAAKPVSTATQTALDLKANLASPTFTGTVVLPAQTVTLAMQANMASASVVYRKTAGAGAPEVNTLATLKTDLVLVKGDVGLGSVDNTTDAGKPVSTAQQTALDLKANIASPTLTGVPAAPTAAVGTNTTQLATTAYARAMPLDTLAAPTDITTLNATTAVHGLLQKLPGGTATFLRADGAFAAPTAAASISQTEIDFGVTPVAEASFLITDANVSPSSKLIGTVAYVAPTGKDLDELDMDGLDLKFAPGSGQFTLYARGLDGYVADRFVINYQVGA